MSRTGNRVRDELSRTLLAPDHTAAIEMRGAVQAAVLVPLYVRRGVVHAVFTERHHELPRHAGEISFPGGRREPEDADLIATALRESHEEVGLPAESVDLIGALEPTPTIVTGYAIYPFVGMVPSGFRWRPQQDEVSAMIDLPLDRVAAGYARRRLIRRGIAIHTDTYSADGHVIWGATARIVSDLLERMNGLLPASVLDDEANGSSFAD